MAELNLDFYKGTDDYTDGEVEDEILDIVRTGRDIHTVLSDSSNWPVLYHFSPERRNLLEWWPFDKSSTVLEVGCGCGALTGLFCEKTRQVTAVELSKKRSEITCQRYKDSSNLSVIAGNIMDIKFSSRFDNIALIGVLEYVRSFVSGPDPWGKLLCRLQSLLKDEGTLFLAIENKFGLKYFAGASEDHTGQPFDGLEGYMYGTSAKTFSRPELAELLQNAGFKKIDFYYPYPDYKLPGEIFSDSYLPEINQIIREAPNFDLDRFKLFSERRALVNIIRNGMFDFFSNSFLVIANK